MGYGCAGCPAQDQELTARPIQDPDRQVGGLSIAHHRDQQSLHGGGISTDRGR